MSLLLRLMFISSLSACSLFAQERQTVTLPSSGAGANDDLRSTLVADDNRVAFAQYSDLQRSVISLVSGRRDLVSENTNKLVTSPGPFIPELEVVAGNDVRLGQLALGQATSFKHRLQNRYSRPLRLTKFEVNPEDNPSASELKKLDFKPVTLAPGAVTSLSFTLQPSGIGFHAIYMRLLHDDPHLGKVTLVMNYEVVASAGSAEISTPIEDQFMALGSEHTLLPRVIGTVGFTCRWLKNGQVLGSQKDPWLHFPKVGASDAGRYRLEVRSAGLAEPLVDEFTLGVFESPERRDVIVRRQDPLQLTVKIWGPGTGVSWAERESFFIRGTNTPTLQVLRAESLVGTTPRAVLADLLIDGRPRSAESFQVGLSQEPLFTLKFPRYLVVGREMAAQANFTDWSGSLVAENLPPGLSANLMHLSISGTPTQPGEYSFTVRGKTSEGQLTAPVKCFVVVVAAVEDFRNFGPAATYQHLLDVTEFEEDNPTSPTLTTLITTAGDAFSGQMRMPSRTHSFRGVWTRSTTDPERRTARVAMPSAYELPGSYLLLEQRLPEFQTPATTSVVLELPQDGGDSYQVDSGEAYPVLPSNDSTPFIASHNTFLLTPGYPSGVPETALGIGFGTVRFNRNLSAAGVATLPDGSSMTFSGPLVGATSIMILQALHVGGHVYGRMNWSAPANATNATEFNGSLSLTRAPKPGSRLYPSGFRNRPMAISGAGFYLPSKPMLPATYRQDQMPNLAFTNEPDAGGLPLNETLNTAIQINPALRITLPGSNPHQVRLQTYMPAGFFIGSFVLNDLLPGNDTKRQRRVVNFSGMLVPELRAGGGLFRIQQLPDPTSTPPTTSQNAIIHTGQVILE
jgi:hypothetical protein